jgi:hypothetical protein
MDHPSTKSAHFLDGFNVEDVQDFRSIPDPPTPQPRKRRLSIPMNLRSFQDVTNNNPESNDSSRKVSSRRARKSLCHVPSPVIEQQQRQEEQETAAGPLVPPHLDESKLPSSAGTPICLDDDHDDGYDYHKRTCSSSSSRRRKKRQSMLFPKDFVGPQQEEVIPAATTLKPSSFQGTLQDMKDLQGLVRGYCSLPLEERDASREARGIEQSTGYVLHNNLKKHTTTETLDHAGRRLIFQMISPVIQQMDQRKLEDTHMWEQETGCRVEKSRSGKYRYYALHTNTKTGSTKYKNRYMAVIHRNTHQRLAKANAWKEKLLVEEEIREPPEPNDTATPSSLVINQEEEEDPADALESALVALDHQVQEERTAAGKTQVPTEKEGECNTSSSMEVCDLSVSLDIGDATNLSSSEEKDLATTTTSSSSSSSSSGEAECTKQNDDTATSSQLVVMPSRDQASEDPDIARAEQKLWRRIDEALKDYSQQVLEVLRDRKRQKMNHTANDTK